MDSSLAEQARLPAAQGQPGPELLDTAIAGIERTFDAASGGWGGAPKFPQPMTIELLLRRAAVTGDARSLAMARQTLDAMADGGIHDQLGGGFHRYATDARWLVPHFEQMLYDNAQLARVYLHAWAVTKDTRYRAVAMGVLDYLLRELTTADGAFAAGQDADLEGVEGATFTWRAAEIQAVLGAEVPLFSAAYGVTDGGNWEGVTILSRVRSAEELGQAFGVSPAEIERRLALARERLLAERMKRPQPARDDKALAAWNGLAIAALADAARMLGFAARSTDGGAIGRADDGAVGGASDDAEGSDGAGAGLAEAAERYRGAAEDAAGAILDGLLQGGRGSEA